MYIKVFDPSGEYVKVEKLDPPCFIKRQISNGMRVRCEDKNEAQEILSEDNQTIYQFNGYITDGQRSFYAEEISEAEYQELSGDDPEDETPEIPDDNPEEVPMTRAELTERVTEQAERIEFLEECLLEMSEAIYA